MSPASVSALTASNHVTRLWGEMVRGWAGLGAWPAVSQGERRGLMVRGSLRTGEHTGGDLWVRGEGFQQRGV